MPREPQDTFNLLFEIPDQGYALLSRLLWMRCRWVSGLLRTAESADTTGMLMRWQTGAT